MAGFLLSRLKRAKWIFNVSDLWPESAVRLGAVKKGLALTLSEKLEAFCYRHAWLVTGQSHEIIANINHRFSSVNTYHLSNGVNSTIFSPEVAPLKNIKGLSPDGELVFFYGGLHGIAQGLDQIIYAAQLFPVGVKFIFVGDGPEKGHLLHLVEDLRLKNIIFLEPVPKEQMPGFLASADVAIVPLKILLPGAVPSKLYEAMASAKPVLLIAEGEAAGIVKEAECGLVIKPGDIDELIQGIEYIRTHLHQRIKFGQNGRKLVLLKYDRTSIIEQFAEFIRFHQETFNEV
jgi:glycosyltransferase involved in cell wall biosynthesis